MAWRFKASKYKNAVPIVPKPENYVRDITVGSYQTYGNNITASASFMAFNWDHAGSSVAVLPLNDSGRKSKLMPLLHAHTDTVTDMAFSPFHDGLLATGSQDCLLKLWHIPPQGLIESKSDPECTFSHKQRRIETLNFHPTADYLLHSTAFTTLNLWDLQNQQELYTNTEHTDVIQASDWKKDGTLLATSAKDKQVRIFDLRSEKACIKSANSHQSIKDSRLVWLGVTDKILTTGFDSQRLRQIIIRDVRQFQTIEKSLELDCSTGILMPLYDPDTGMLFLAGKGDTTIGYMEVSDKEPYLTEGIRHSGEQTKGACLVPKRALNVMQGEVNRILQLTSTSVIPITYQVPRKTYRDFHADLYPDTTGFKTELTADEWMQGKNWTITKISLDPSKRTNDEPISVHRGSLNDMLNEQKITTNSNKSTTFTTDLNKHTDDVSPPKPLPRTSRTGSLCENVNDNDFMIIKPVARPRTNSVQPIVTSVNPNAPITGGYKPRLGPKPFTPPKLLENESFDRVFAVPSVPITSTPQNGVVHPVEQADVIVEQSPTSDLESTPICGNDTENGSKSDEDEAVVDEDSGYVPKTTPTTAERRRLFENKTTSKDDEDRFDGGGDFDRSSMQRTSIAERRKMYENRSLSVQESGTIIQEKSGENSPIMFRRKDSLKKKVDEKKDKIDIAPVPKRTSTVFGRVSKFRHLKGTPAHKSLHIENIRNLSRQISGECDGFHANPERVAVPLSGPGGKIAIFELKKTGKLPDGVIPALVQGGNVMDFAWNPFDNRRLAVACDDGIIKLWLIPIDGLTEPTNEPENEFNAHPDKIYFIRFHPTTNNVLASGSYDMTIKIWNLDIMEMIYSLKGHTEQIFSFAWSPCGNLCTTVSKDGKIRLYKPRNNPEPLDEGKGPVGSRGARITWALDGNFVVVTGFDKVSERQIIVYKSDDLNTPLNTIGLDVSPAILIPFYDEDSSTLFVTGKGDSTIYAFEITEESPYICALSHHRCNNLHQGLSFLPKIACDVANVEFAKALRLTNTSIEPLSFTVPRIKTEYFQDDLFPPTRVTWRPTLSASEWFGGKDKRPPRVSMKPEGMECLSDTQTERTLNKSASSPFISGQISNKSWLNDGNATKLKQDEIQRSVSNRMEINLKLEQDDMEGVDEKEWNE